LTDETLAINVVECGLTQQSPSFVYLENGAYWTVGQITPPSTDFTLSRGLLGLTSYETRKLISSIVLLNIHLSDDDITEEHVFE
jgi:hypothetical protein